MPSVTELSQEEHLTFELIRAIRADAETSCAPDKVELVSVTIDVSADLNGQTDVRFVPLIDRKTRTILFTKGTAYAGDAAIMTATAVYRIMPAG